MRGPNLLIRNEDTYQVAQVGEGDTSMMMAQKYRLAGLAQEVTTILATKDV
jgi:hypothetical protein